MAFLFCKTCKERLDTRGDGTVLLMSFSGYGIDGGNTKACVKLFYAEIDERKEIFASSWCHFGSSFCHTGTSGCNQNAQNKLLFHTKRFMLQKR